MNAGCMLSNNKEKEPSVIKRKLYKKTGTEGPKHDPYAYEEITLRTTYADGKTFTVAVHQGLAEWTKLNDKLFWHTHGKATCDEILGMVGLNYRLLEKLANEQRCFKCGGTKGKWIEFGIQCARCGEYIYFEDPMGKLSDYE